jgi:uncharacterized membrane protein YphA (DoxX/SURF4 family)
MKINSKIVFASRIIVGLTFIFSGFVKGVDPMGFQIKIEEYLIAFNMPWLTSLAIVAAICFICLEFVLGVGMLLGVKIRQISAISLILMLFFLVQTFVLALWNPVQDCGCFGDAIKLTNWETFYKNVVLIIFVLIVFLARKRIRPWFPSFGEARTLLTAFVLILLVCIYSRRFLPLIDFLPYKQGNDIAKLMVIPDNAPRDVYETILIYKNKKTNDKKEFNMENIPSDSEWEWVETKNILVKKGYRPPIHDFSIVTNNGEDLTQKFLHESGGRILIVQEQVKNSNYKGQKKLNKLVKDLVKNTDVKIWALTSSLKEEIDQYSKENNVPYVYYSTDQTTLKTIVRSNPGVLLLKNNVIIKKWPSRRIPDEKTLMKYLYR